MLDHKSSSDAPLGYPSCCYYCCQLDCSPSLPTKPQPNQTPTRGCKVYYWEANCCCCSCSCCSSPHYKVCDITRRRQTLYEVARLCLMAQMDLWQNSTPFFGAAAFCTPKIDNFRAAPACHLSPSQIKLRLEAAKSTTKKLIS